MKLKYDFLTMDSEDRTLVFPVGDGSSAFHGMLKVNDSALEILNLLKTETTEPEIVDNLASRFDTGRAEIEKYVKEYISRLREAGLIEE